MVLTLESDSRSVCIHIVFIFKTYIIYLLFDKLINMIYYIEIHDNHIIKSLFQEQ